MNFGRYFVFFHKQNVWWQRLQKRKESLEDFIFSAVAIFFLTVAFVLGFLIVVARADEDTFMIQKTDKLLEVEDVVFEHGDYKAKEILTIDATPNLSFGREYYSGVIGWEDKGDHFLLELAETDKKYDGEISKFKIFKETISGLKAIRNEGDWIEIAFNYWDEEPSQYLVIWFIEGFSSETYVSDCDFYMVDGAGDPAQMNDLVHRPAPKSGHIIVDTHEEALGIVKNHKDDRIFVYKISGKIEEVLVEWERREVQQTVWDSEPVLKEPENIENKPWIEL